MKSWILLRWGSLAISSVRRRSIGRWCRSKTLRWGSLTILRGWPIVNRRSTVRRGSTLILRRTVGCFTIHLVLFLLVGLQHWLRRTSYVGSRIKHVVVDRNFIRRHSGVIHRVRCPAWTGIGRRSGSNGVLSLRSSNRRLRSTIVTHAVVIFESLWRVISKI